MADANGLRFWMLANRCDWQLETGADYDRARRSLRLSNLSERRLEPQLPDGVSAESLVERVPQARDGSHTRAYWDSPSGQVRAAGAVPGSVAIFTPPNDERVSDLALGFDGVLYLTLTDGTLVLQDRRDRWDPVPLKAPGFSAWRIATDPGGGAWALERSSSAAEPSGGRLARVQGLPLPHRPQAEYAPSTFRPCPENPNPPHLDVYTAPAFPDSERAAGLAVSPRGQVAWLTWDKATGESRLRLLLSGGRCSNVLVLAGAFFAYSLAWVQAGQVAVLIPGLSEAAVFAIPEWMRASGSADLVDQWCDEPRPLDDGQPVELHPVGDLYPLPGHNGEPFVHGLDLPPHFPLTRGDPAEGDSSAPLYHLSLPSFARSGSAANRANTPIDSGDAQTVWHRLYVEADLPPGCGAVVWLAATSTRDVPASPLEWFGHCLGQSPRQPGQPQGAWMPFPSEIAHHPGLLDCQPVKDRSGLFTLLVQRSDRRVRSLRGRYLHVRVELFGTGRASPEIAALRAYGSRFSYLERYLPQLYHETLFGPDADAQTGGPGQAAVQATPADFLERFLDNFEGILTPLEDRVAEAHLLTDPHTAPTATLEWLGSWVGMVFDMAYPAECRREALAHAAELHRLHGTLPGLKLALEIATAGGLSGGEIIVLEDFRLRRTFATILGVDLTRADDPLLAGISVSGNSFVGDTLFLGDEQTENRREFLALFSAGQVVDPADQKAVMALYDRLAHRATVLVHQEVEPQDLGLIQRVVDLESPAHVQVKILKASRNFMVGLAALVGVDTYLGIKPRPRAVRLGSQEGFLASGYNVNAAIYPPPGLARFGSALGVRDLLLSPGSLDPRLEAGLAGTARLAERPLAVAGPPKIVDFNQDFELDAGRSQPGPGHILTRYIWELKE